MRIQQHGQPLLTITDRGQVFLASDVNQVTADSRRVEPGALFVALPGLRTHGRRFIGEALQRGATGVVVPPDVAPMCNRWVSCSQPRLLYGHLASAAHRYPSRQATIVAVTGTNGKTSVVEFGAQLLNQAGIPAATIGTLSDSLGTRGLTTPVAEDLQMMLARLVRSGIRVVLLETSSHALVQHRLAGVDVDYSVLTTLARDHLDYHRSLESYWAAKRRLVKSPLSPWYVRPRRGVILPASEARRFQRFRDHVKVPILYYGGPFGTVSLFGRALKLSGLTVTARISLLETTLELPWLGDGSVPSLEAAIAIALNLGVAPETIVQALPALHVPPGRLEWYRIPNGPWVVIDYAHNPEALDQLLRGVRRLFPRACVTSVFGGRGHRDRGKLYEMGRVVAQHADRLVVTVDCPYDEDPASLAETILRGSRAGGLVGTYVDDRWTALMAAVWGARRGDVVVVTGRGHEITQAAYLGARNVGTDGEWVQRALGAVPFQVATPGMPPKRPGLRGLGSFRQVQGQARQTS